MEVIELEVEVIDGNVLPVDPVAVLANETRQEFDAFVRMALTAPAAIADDRHANLVRDTAVLPLCLIIAGLIAGLCASVGAFLF